MKMYLISDNIDTLTGMRLAGIPGVVAHGKDELEAALTAAFADPDIGVLLLTEKFGRDFPEYVNRGCRLLSTFRTGTAAAAGRISLRPMSMRR